jgi:tRNA(fMet)-specific endonuclease VapC
MRRYMLDTNTVSYIIKGKSATARAKLAGLGTNEIACISAITEAELWYGVAKNPQATALPAAVNAFLVKIETLSWGHEEARAYGNLRAQQEKRGKTLGNLDLLIAAHAIATGSTLVTNDKAFTQIPNLSATVNWASESAL